MVNTGGSSACGGDGASFSGPLDMTEQFFTSATFLFFLNLRRTFDVKRVEVYITLCLHCHVFRHVGT